MASRIKGITIKIGGDTTDLQKALQNTNKNISDTQTQLRDVERLLKLDPKNTELLAQKQKLLAKATDDTREKLDKLKTASEQAAKSAGKYEEFRRAFEPIQKEIGETDKALRDLKQQQEALGERTDANCEAYDEIQKAIDETSRKLKDLKKQQKNLGDEFGNPISPESFDSLQREIVETEKKLEGLGDQAKNTAKKMRSVPESMDEISEKADKLSGAMAPVTAAVAGLAGAVAATVPASEELRTDLSRLDANARAAGVGVDVARKAWEEFVLQSGETDSALEGISNLLQAGFTESNLQIAAENLAAAANAFPDTLKVESLADGLQETLATGEATGQFCELLERMGLDVEQFNTALAACQTETGRQNLALNTLAKAGLKDSYDAWKENNSAMLENKQANLDMEQSIAELAEVAMPILTDVTQLVADLISWFANLPGPAQGAIVAFLAVAGSISPISGAVSNAIRLMDTMKTTVLPGLKNAFSSTFGFIAAHPVVLLIGAIVGMVALFATKGDEIQAIFQKVDDFMQDIFATDFSELCGPVLGGALDMFFAMFSGIWDNAMLILNGFIDIVRGIATGDWERAWLGFQEVCAGVFNGLLGIVTVPVNGIIDCINLVISAINLAIDAVNTLFGLSLSNVDLLDHWDPQGLKIPDPDPDPGAGSSGASVGSARGGAVRGSGASALPMLASGGVVYSGSAIVGEAGAELLTVSNGRAIVQPLGGGTTNHNAYLGGVNITVNAAPGQSATEVADIVMERMQVAIDRKGASL